MEQFLVMFGSEVKASANGRFTGYLVRFSSAETPDLAGDFFTKDTDFGIVKGQKTPIYFNHRMPLKMKGGGQIMVKHKIGEGSMEIDETGVLLDAIIWNRDNYEKAIIQAGQKNLLGWSSGTAAHLVDYEPAGKSKFIKSWPLGLDASLTPVPCEPLNHAVEVSALRSIKYLGFVKGIFQEAMEMQTPSRWEMESTYGSVVRKIAAAASVARASGAEFDLEAMLSEATNEYASMLQATALGQIKDWLDAGATEDFYLKTMGDVEQQVSAFDDLDIDTHSRLTVSVLRGFGSRLRGNHEARLKAGRVLSEKNRRHIKETVGQLMSVRDDLHGLMNESMMGDSTVDAEKRAKQTERFMAKYRYDRR